MKRILAVLTGLVLTVLLAVTVVLSLYGAATLILLEHGALKCAIVKAPSA